MAECDNDQNNQNNSDSSEFRQDIVDLGSSTIRTARGTIHTLTIVGQIEGHQELPSNAKATKYEHVLPLLAAVEESEDIDGLLVLLNTERQGDGSSVLTESKEGDVRQGDGSSVG